MASSISRVSAPPFLPYGRQTVDEEDIAAIAAVLRSDWLTQGPAVPAFERGLCERFGVGSAVVVNSGTAALHAGMLALGIGSGDVVVVPPITFVATANAALLTGADVAFADVEPDTGLISADALERLIRGWHGPGRLRAVAVVHYAGLPVDMNRIAALCAEHELHLIEDACHAPGARWIDGGGAVRMVGDGTDSDFTALSFHPVKHFTTAEGGALLTTNSELAERARQYRSHGVVRNPSELWRYDVESVGLNYRMPDVLAVLGSSQLRKFDGWLAHRRELAARYRDALGSKPGITLQAERPGREHAYHLFPVLVEDRDRVMTALRAEGIGTQVHYVPVHQHPYYRRKYGAQSFPAAESWCMRELSLPLFPGMQDEDVHRVCEALARVVA